MPTPIIEPEEGGGLRLIDFLSLLAAVAACSGAVIAGQSTAWHVASWVIGLTTGAASSVLLWKLTHYAIQYLRLNTPKLPLPRLAMSWSLVLAGIAWVVASAFVGYAAMNLFARLTA